jgi:hypothetical protein
MEFEEYLKGKKIDPTAFKAGEPTQFEEFSLLFAQVHPDSFTQQKLFLINPIRRKYPLTEVELEKKPAAAKTMRPKMKPLKPKTN